MDRPYRRPWTRFVCYVSGLFLLACVRWITNSFGSPTIQQIAYHLQFLGDLLSQPDRIFVVTFSVECLLGPLILAAALTVSERSVGRWLLASAAANSTTNPVTWKLSFYALRALPALVLSCGLAAFSYRYSVPSYLASRFGTDRFAQLYVDPATVRLRQSSQKNLILIYVESLEATYSDEAIFGANLLQNLDAVPGESFSSYLPAPGTGWTIAAMVGTQCGIPLQFVTRMDDVGEAGEHVKSFLPGATCLTDILHEFGYKNIFLGGASLKFAGKGKFLRTHHYDKVYGYEEWMKARDSVHGWNVWGIFDDDLFTFAKQQLATLHSSSAPFNLTLLTLDTHHPNGFYSKSCRNEGREDFQTIVRCVSGELADFVRSVELHGYLEDTNIVIVGDHLAMPNPVYSKLLSSSHRKIYNKFISNPPLQKSTEELIPFDLFPTLLEYVGIDVDGQRLGLGRSGVFRGKMWKDGPRTEASPEILNFSRKYEDLWTKAAGD